MPQAGPLSGITIVDLSRILAGPYCTLLMAELGARVIKVEAPKTGDDARQYGPFKNGKSTYFASVNRGKESIVLNLKAAGDREIFERLLDKADAVVENFRPGTMEKLGYGWDDAAPALPPADLRGRVGLRPYRAVLAVSVLRHGRAGAGRHHEHHRHPGWSAGAGRHVGRRSRRRPLYYNRAQRGAAAPRAHRRGDQSRCRLVRLPDRALENAVMRYTTTGEIPGPMGARHPSITPFEAFATSDGHIIIAAGNDGLFVKMAQAIGRPDLAENPLFKTNPLRNQHQPALKAEIEAALSGGTTEHWIAVLEKAGLPCGPVNNVAQAVAHPQVEARNMLIECDDPVTGPLKLAGNPMKLSAFADPPTRDPAPDLDADRAAILKELGL